MKATKTNLLNKFNLGSFIHKYKNKIQMQEDGQLQLVEQEVQRAIILKIAVIRTNRLR